MKSRQSFLQRNTEKKAARKPNRKRIMSSSPSLNRPLDVNINHESSESFLKYALQTLLIKKRTPVKKLSVRDA